METYKVWLQSRGDDAELRIEGHRHATAVAGRLESEGYAVSEAVQLEGSAQYLLHAGYRPGHDHLRLQQLLAAMPEVELMGD